MSRIYVASSWRNEYQPDVCKLLLLAGHEIYDFRNPPGKAGFKWSDIEKEYQSWNMPRYRELLTTHETAAHGFTADLRGMMWADVGLLVLPCGRSAHLEAGWFAGAHKRLVIYIPEPIEPDLMYLLASQIVLTEQEMLEAVA